MNLEERIATALQGITLAITHECVMKRMQERWPTEHGYHEFTVKKTLEAMRDAGKVHQHANGRWTPKRPPGFKSREGMTSPPRPKPEPAVIPPAAATESAAEPPEEAPVNDNTETTDVKTKTCPGCKKTKPLVEFFSNGYCKPCGREKAREYAARKKANGGNAAKVRQKPDPKVKRHVRAGGKRKANGNGAVPLQLGADRMVIMQFAIRIEDSAGHVHDLFLTGDTVKRLAIELQEYA